MYATSKVSFSITRSYCSSAETVGSSVICLLSYWSCPSVCRGTSWSMCWCHFTLVDSLSFVSLPFPVREQSIVLSMSVCPRAYLRNHTSKLYQFLCACFLWPLFGPCLAVLQYVVHFCLVDDIMLFSSVEVWWLLGSLAAVLCTGCYYPGTWYWLYHVRGDSRCQD